MVLNPAVELRNVTTVYSGENRPAIRNSSLEMNARDYVLVTGPNGSGKTTLLETILGILKPVSGVVKVFGYDMVRSPYKARMICSYLPQDFMKKPDEPFKVREIVAMGIASKRSLGRLSREDWKRVDEVLELLGIAELSDRPIGRLSGGQQQKVFLARALSRDPKLLLLDEPFSSLDDDSRKFVADLLYKLNRRGMTIILVSHAPPKIAGLTIRVHLVDGCISSVERCSS